MKVSVHTNHENYTLNVAGLLNCCKHTSHKLMQTSNAQSCLDTPRVYAVQFKSKQFIYSKKFQHARRNKKQLLFMLLMDSHEEQKECCQKHNTLQRK